MSLADSTAKQPATDLAKQLGDTGISVLLRLMCDAYYDLRRSGQRFDEMNEPEIAASRLPPCTIFCLTSGDRRGIATEGTR